MNPNEPVAGSMPSRLTTGRRGSPLGRKPSRVLSPSTPGLNAYCLVTTQHQVPTLPRCGACRISPRRASLFSGRLIDMIGQPFLVCNAPSTGSFDFFSRGLGAGCRQSRASPPQSQGAHMIASEVVNVNPGGRPRRRSLPPSPAPLPSIAGGAAPDKMALGAISPPMADAETGGG